MKLTEKLLFKIKFPKVDKYSEGKWFIYGTKHREDSTLQAWTHL